jgi:hypothetical protein
MPAPAKKHNPVKKGLAKKALAAAKELEHVHEPSRAEITHIYKEGLQHARELQKLLKRAWFVKDTDKAPHPGDVPRTKRVRLKRPKR